MLCTCQQTGWRFGSLRGAVPTKDRISLNTPSSVFTLCLCLILTSPDFHREAVVIYNMLVTSLLPNLSRSFTKPCPAMSTWTDPESLARSGQKQSETLVKLLKMFSKNLRLDPGFLSIAGDTLKHVSSITPQSLNPRSPSHLFHSETLLPLTFPISQHSWAVPHQSKGQFMGLMLQRVQTGL